jgi:hypothetical protein
MSAGYEGDAAAGWAEKRSAIEVKTSAFAVRIHPSKVKVELGQDVDLDGAVRRREPHDVDPHVRVRREEPQDRLVDVPASGGAEPA